MNPAKVILENGLGGAEKYFMLVSLNFPSLINRRITDTHSWQHLDLRFRAQRPASSHRRIR